MSYNYNVIKQMEQQQHNMLINSNRNIEEKKRETIKHDLKVQFNIYIIAYIYFNLVFESVLEFNHIKCNV